MLKLNRGLSDEVGYNQISRIKSVTVVLEDREKELIRMWINRGDSMNTYLTNSIYLSRSQQ